MIAWMMLQILIHFVTRNLYLMKIVFVVTDDALVLASAFAFTFTLFLALSTAGRRPKSEAEGESDDENTSAFAELRRPQI